MRFLHEFLDWASACLDGSSEAEAYLLGRGVSAEQRVRHRLGYVGGDFFVDPSSDPLHSAHCDDRDSKSRWCDSCRFLNWSSLWTQDEDGVKVRVPGRRIAGGIVFPLASYSGSLVGIQIRSLEGKSYDTFLLRRRPEGYFFGLPSSLDSIWSRREVFLVEGGFDHLTLERLVAPNVLALTTNAVNAAQRRFLYRFVDRVNLCLDMDQAGRDGVARFLERDGASFRTTNVRYPRVRPSDKDLNDFWRRVGDDAFRRHFDKNVFLNQ